MEDLGALMPHDVGTFLKRAFDAIEHEVAPLTAEGIRQGSKLFGAALLRKDDLSTVIVATNHETDNPLLHGEITLINNFYSLPASERPQPKDCIFIATHEPCPLCLGGITWAGFDNFFYFFTYEDSRDPHGIPHDIDMPDSIFRCPDGAYNESKRIWMRQQKPTCSPSDMSTEDQCTKSGKPWKDEAASSRV